MMKHCNGCGQDLPIDNFARRKNSWQHRCKDCANKKYTEYRSQWTIEDRVKDQARRYGLDLEEVLSYYKNHDGLCDICRQPNRRKGADRLVIDHNHDTGEFRGLIYNKCNVGLGQFDDSILKMEQAIEYIKRGGKR